ncbi:CorA Metal Ion transporter (MIT) Family [Phytophthora palmivora]|uniref:CorA Metal Ion transporter (MIT) Family n=1 Tax=Phytophthora palmivora TaxID=4796 RepID=A0A2P4X346_9STRA|nr:CorA Metal Ion transporter (MIT) Family [Phytophthora palmivora]
MLLLLRSVRSQSPYTISSISHAFFNPLRSSTSSQSVGNSRAFYSSIPHWNRCSFRPLTSLTPDKPIPELPTLHGKNLLNLVSRARDSHPLDWSEGTGVAEETDQLDLMDPHYDLTTAKIIKLFSLFQPNDDGMVSYDGFRRGLQAMGISCENEDEFKAFIGQVDDDKSGGISYQEFLYAIQEIKLAQLFSPEFVTALNQEYVKVYGHDAPVARLGSIEYSPDRIRSAYPIEGVEKFMYSTKPNWASVRWINVEGTDPLMMRRLAVRYRLHPLAVEDTLDADLERPKYENYEEHSSLILQTVHARDLKMALEYQSMYRASLYVRDNGVSPFENMSKAELERRLDELGMGRIMAPPEQLSVYIMDNVVISVQESRSTLWPTLKQRLDTSYSKVRQSGTAFLVYSIVDVCVDELSPIAHTYGAKVTMLSRLLRHDPQNFDVDRLAKCSKEIKGLKLLCKPLRELTAQLMESKDFEGETLRYFRDVQDHVTVIDEICDRLLDRCRSLVDECHNARHAQQSEVSYTLTLVATVFLPAQFLTGLYGMNFVNMPELQYENGYMIWWGVVSTIATGTISYFKFYKKWL